MKRLARLRNGYLRGAYVFLAVWPLLHMQLSFVMEFSPWKFMGWGMYAVPYPDYRQVVAFQQPYNCRSPQLITQGIQRPMIIERGPRMASSFFEVYNWMLDGVVRQPVVMPPMEFFALFREVKRFHVLNTEAALSGAMQMAEKFGPVLVGALGPRVDLDGKRIWWELSLYRYEHRRARLISHFRSGDVDPILRIGRELDCI
jgi:hypothetical protein